MIYASIRATRPASYPPALHTALDYLASHDITAMEPGRYDIDGERMYVMISDAVTAPASQKQGEAHKKYIDLQYVAAGVEMLAVAPLLPGLPVERDRMDTDDYILYKHTEDEQTVTLTPGYYALLFPEDIHKPSCCCGEPSAVRKAVVKILTETFDRP